MKLSVKFNKITIKHSDTVGYKSHSETVIKLLKAMINEVKVLNELNI